MCRYLLIMPLDLVQRPCWFVVNYSDEDEAELGQDVCNDAHIGHGLFEAHAGRNETSQLRHANQLPRARRGIQRVSPFVIFDVVCTVYR